MEELVLEDRQRPGILRRFISWLGFGRDLDEDQEEVVINVKSAAQPKVATAQQKAAARYTVTIRRQISSKDDAVIAAIGFKRGEQQAINLTMTDATTRLEIVEFLKGVAFALEGSWEEVGDNVYLLVPPTAYVELAAATPKISYAA